MRLGWRIAKVAGVGLACLALTSSQALAFGACNKENMRVQTGRAQQSLNIDPDSVQITEPKCGIMAASWTAHLNNGDIYKCKSDDMLRNPYCFKVEQPKASAPTSSGSQSPGR